MKRRSLLLLLAGSGCHGSGGPALRLGSALVELAVRAAPGAEQQAAQGLRELERLREVTERELAANRGRSLSELLSELIFGRFGFVREVEDTSLGFVLLPSVLERRRGSCVGLGTLFLALVEGLGGEASGIMRPGHFYVRAREAGGARNVELLRRGEAMPDAWYARRFPVPGGSAHEYGRPLSVSEVLGVVEYNVGNERRRQLRLPESRAAFSRAVRLFPELAEAHASLGAVEQLLGDLAAARASYQRAQAVNPQLPGVAQNLALLEAETTTALPTPAR
jgi:regulator of sirC expression with transglutaminase-like and TPR domain